MLLSISFLAEGYFLSTDMRSFWTSRPRAQSVYQADRLWNWAMSELIWINLQAHLFLWTFCSLLASVFPTPHIFHYLRHDHGGKRCPSQRGVKRSYYLNLDSIFFLHRFSTTCKTAENAWKLWPRTFKLGEHILLSWTELLDFVI